MVNLQKVERIEITAKTKLLKDVLQEKQNCLKMFFRKNKKRGTISACPANPPVVTK